MALSNQNNRTIAILKVIGLYLFSFILLAFIFSANTNGEINPTVEKDFKMLEDKNERLEDLIILIDSITTLTNNLTELEQKKAEDPKKHTFKYNETSHKIGDLGKEIAAVKNLPKSILKRIENITNQLAAMEKFAGDCYKEISRIQESTTEEKEQEIEANEQETSAEVEGLEGENSGLQAQLDDANDEITRLGNEANTNSEKITELTDKINNISTKVKEIKVDAETATKINSGNKKDKITEYKNISTLIFQKLESLDNTINLQ